VGFLPDLAISKRQRRRVENAVELDSRIRSFPKLDGKMKI